MTIARLSAPEAQQLVAQGARLIDIRDADEFARERIPGAINWPLARIAQLPKQDCPVIFHCRSGLRTEANAAPLEAASAGAPCHILAGGIDAWRAADLPTILDRRQPMEIMRQVQLAAGGLVLLGVVLGFLAAPGFFAISAFVGAGLMLAGATGWCGMAKLLQLMSWNRRSLTG
jgi:rhodanese-related sulfurtransferase